MEQYSLVNFRHVFAVKWLYSVENRKTIRIGTIILESEIIHRVYAALSKMEEFKYWGIKQIDYIMKYDLTKKVLFLTEKLPTSSVLISLSDELLNCCLHSGISSHAVPFSRQIHKPTFLLYTGAKPTIDPF